MPLSFWRSADQIHTRVKKEIIYPLQFCCSVCSKWHSVIEIYHVYYGREAKKQRKCFSAWRYFTSPELLTMYKVQTRLWIEHWSHVFSVLSWQSYNNKFQLINQHMPIWQLTGRVHIFNHRTRRYKSIIDSAVHISGKEQNFKFCEVKTIERNYSSSHSRPKSLTDIR